MSPCPWSTWDWHEQPAAPHCTPHHPAALTTGLLQPPVKTWLRLHFLSNPECNPQVRINGRQYRGSLDVGGVMRAICSGFPAGQEPAVCNQGWVSEDECAPGGVGYLACMSG